VLSAFAFTHCQQLIVIIEPYHSKPASVVQARMTDLERIQVSLSVSTARFLHIDYSEPCCFVAWRNVQQADWVTNVLQQNFCWSYSLVLLPEPYPFVCLLSAADSWPQRLSSDVLASYFLCAHCRAQGVPAAYCNKLDGI
jgi:hypothetical protein